MTPQPATPDNKPLFDNRKPLLDLAGEDNRLWKIALAVPESGADFGRLDDWWQTQGRDLDFYAMYADGPGKEAQRSQARDWVQGAVSVSRALDCFRSGEPSRTGAQVRGYLDEAVSAYGRILGWPDHPARPADLAVCAKEDGELDAAVLTRAELVRRRLAELEDPNAWGPGHPGVGMVRSALSLEYEGDSLLGKRTQHGSIQVLFDREGFGASGNNGPASVATLYLERFIDIGRAKGKAADGHSLVTGFFPDPIGLGCVVLDDDFRWSLIDAWALTQHHFQGGGWVRWRLAKLAVEPHIAGGSLGGAFAVGLRRLARRRRFDGGITLTAALTESQKNRGKVEWASSLKNTLDGKLHHVEGISNKVNAARKAGIDLVIVCPEDQQRYQSLGAIIAPAGTVDEALKAFAFPRRAWQQCRRRPVLAGLSVLALVLLLCVPAATIVFQIGAARRDREIAQEVRVLLRQANVSLGVGRPAEAREALGEANGRLRSASSALQHEFASQAADLKMLVRLEDVRLNHVETTEDGLHLVHADSMYDAAFRDYGIDVAAGDPAQVADLFKVSAIKMVLVAALDHWAQCTTDKGRARRLRAIADATDDQPASMTHQLRRALADGDKITLLRLASEPRVAEQKPSTVISLATGLHDLGAIDDSARLLKAAQQQEPRDFWLNLVLGATLLFSQPSEPRDALPFLTAALAVSGHNPGVYSYVANAQLKANKLTDAEASYRQAIALKPDFVLAHINLGFVLTKQGKLKEGEEILVKATELDPNSYLAHYNLGVNLQRQGKNTRAAQAYERAIAIRPNLVEALNNYGNTLTSLGRFDAALEAFEKAIALQPAYAKAHFNRGYVLDKQRRFGDAVVSYRRAITHERDYAEAYYHIAFDLLYQEGKFKEAQSELEQGLQFVRSGDPKRANWLHLISECRRLREADLRLDLYLTDKTKPKNAADACELALLAAWPHRKLFGEAARLYEHAFALEPARAEDIGQGYRYHAARCAAKAGCGLSRDRLGDDEQARWRRQALEWLRADLALRRQQIKDGGPEQAREAREKLRYWPTDPDLACVWEPSSLERLPKPESEEWRDMWSQVGASSER